MINVLVTGAEGFIGKNLCERLAASNRYGLLKINRKSSQPTLLQYVDKSDVVVHLAATMRPKNEKDYFTINSGLTELIIHELERVNHRPRFIFTSSVQAELDNAYGQSKLNAENLILEWADKNKSDINILRLPNVFGRYAKPHYSSVVATFCDNLARGKDIEIHDKSRVMNLVYIDTVVDILVRCIDNQITNRYPIITDTFNISLAQLAKRLVAIAAKNKEGVKDYSGRDRLDTLLIQTYYYYLNSAS